MSVQRWVLKNRESSSVIKAVYLAGLGYLYWNPLKQEFFLTSTPAQNPKELERDSIFFVTEIHEDTKLVPLSDRFVLEKDSHTALVSPFVWHNTISDQEELIPRESTKKSALAHLVILSLLFLITAVVKKENPSLENKKIVRVKLAKPVHSATSVSQAQVSQQLRMVQKKELSGGSIKTTPQLRRAEGSARPNNSLSYSEEQKSLQALRSIVRSGFVSPSQATQAKAISVASASRVSSADLSKVYAQSQNSTQTALQKADRSGDGKYHVNESYHSVKVASGSQGAFSLPQASGDDDMFGLDRDQIIAVVNRHRGEVVACYEQALKANPSLQGKVAVQFVIGPQGKVVKAFVKDSDIRDAGLSQCIVSRLKLWAFPSPVGKVNVDVYYPFHLRKVSAR
jgi:hypothetical protein